MGTAELILMGQATIKLIIDMVIKPTIEEENHKYIPYVALALGIAWSLAFMWGDLATAISSGVAMWLWAMWVNKMSTIAVDLKKKSSIEDRDPNDYPEDAGFDRPDKRDYIYEALFWIDYALTRPNYVNLAEGLSVQNQWEANIPSTSMACNGYWMAQWVNWNNTLDDWGVFVVGSELWKRFYDKYNEQYKANWIDMLTEGSYKQDMLTFARDSEIIIAYFLCKSADDICENLARGRAIHTGSKKIDWKATKLNAWKIAVIWTGAAHIFAIVGYDDSKKLFICMNSRGDKWADKGFFYLRYEDYDALYTSHALFDFDDQPIFDAAMTLKDEILTEAKRKIEAGEKLTIREKIALRNRWYAHLIPKNEA